MKKLTTNKILIFIILGLLLLGCIFYWYEIRPAKIRHDCSRAYSGDYWYEFYDAEYYNFCIHEKGLSK